MNDEKHELIDENHTLAYCISFAYTGRLLRKTANKEYNHVTTVTSLRRQRLACLDRCIFHAYTTV